MPHAWPTGADEVGHHDTLDEGGGPTTTMHAHTGPQPLRVPERAREIAPETFR